jgi:HlyD family secretion protein
MTATATPPKAIEANGPALEDLDALVEITSPHAWASLTMLVFVCAGAVLFAVAYEVPKKLHGEGILLVEREALAQVRSPGEGRLASLDVRLGDCVAAHQTIGLLSQEDLKDEIRETKTRLAELRSEHDRLSAFEDDERLTQKMAVDRLREALRTTIDNNRAGLKVAERIKDGARRLLSRNLLNNLDLLESMEKLYEIRTTVDASDSKLAELDLTWLSAENARNKAALQRRLELNRLETKLGVASAKLDRRSRIVSPVDGKVTQILSAANELVLEGSPVVLLSTHRNDSAADEVPGPSECVVFVPAGEGKKIDAGNEVEVVPATVKREEHGFILGRVTAVSEMPATRLAMETALPHPDLVDSFLKKYAPGVLLRVHVDLKEPPPGGTVRRNRFLWSSRSGPDQPLKTATMCQAAVVVERQRMIELIVPWTKRLLSID